jgi:hypothetical protein
MKNRSVWRILSIFACAALLAVPAPAGDDETQAEGIEGSGVCTLDGAWFGATPAWGLTWTVVYDSDSHWTGPLSLRFIGGDPTLGGFFPDVRSLSGTTGTWVRTGRRTFDYTMIHYGLAEGGQQPVFLLKNTGSVVVTGDCDGLDITNHTLAFYDPTQDPFDDDPFLCLSDGTGSTARRIPVEPPCEPTP